MGSGYIMPVTGSANALARLSDSPSPLPAGADSISQANYTAAQLRQANAHLLALEQMLAQNVQNPPFVRKMSDPIEHARARYSTILKAYLFAYSKAFGQTPDTTGLGQWEIYVSAGVSLSVVAAAALELYQYITGVLEKQAQSLLAASQNAAYAVNQASAAQQAGDSATAAQWMGVARRASRFTGLGDDAPPPPAIDPATGLPLSSTPPPVTSFGPPPGYVSTLPLIISSIPSLALAPFGVAPSGSDTLDETSAGVEPPDSPPSGGNYLIPDSSFSDVVQNAMTGTLTPSQAQRLVEQETTGLIRAGLDPQTAAQQAASDVKKVLTMNNANPGQSWIAWLKKNWPWLAVAGAGVLFLPKVIE